MSSGATCFGVFRDGLGNILVEQGHKVWWVFDDTSLVAINHNNMWDWESWLLKSHDHFWDTQNVTVSTFSGSRPVYRTFPTIKNWEKKNESKILVTMQIRQTTNSWPLPRHQVIPASDVGGRTNADTRVLLNMKFSERLCTHELNVGV